MPPFSSGDLVRVKESAISAEALKGYMAYYRSIAGLSEQWFEDKIKLMVGTVMVVASGAYTGSCGSRYLVTTNGSVFSYGFTFRPQDLEVVFTK